MKTRSHSSALVREQAAALGDSLVIIDQADLGYGKRRVLSNITLEVKQNDFIAIVGPNGAGKTTILKTMLGVIRPLRGCVWRASGTRFGYVPQQRSVDEIFPFTAFEVASMGRYAMTGLIGRPSKADREFVLHCMDEAGVADLADRQFRELSGGQKQRVLIARSLAAEPNVLALDEPTNDMDVASEYAIMNLLQDLYESRRIAIVMVSHELNLVVNYAKTIVLIDRGIKAAGSLSEILSSESLSHVYGLPIQLVECGRKSAVVVGE
ncbi:MAG: metal ABC transporter ATP-binding protein [Armatimonadota bacterium]